jgi:hypothetical protein
VVSTQVQHGTRLEFFFFFFFFMELFSFTSLTEGAMC